MVDVLTNRPCVWQEAASEVGGREPSNDLLPLARQSRNRIQRRRVRPVLTVKPALLTPLQFVCGPGQAYLCA